MLPSTYRSSRPDSWNAPRAHSDAIQRYRKYGPIRPMDEDGGFFRRLFRR
jgi:hypothetical protein